MLKSGSAVAQRKLCWERPTKALVDQTDRQGWFSKSDFGSVSKRHCLYAMIHSWKHQSAKLNMLLLPWGLVGESPLLLLCYQLGIVEQVAGFNLSALGVLAVVPGGKQSDVLLRLTVLSHSNSCVGEYVDPFSFIVRALPLPKDAWVWRYGYHCFVKAISVLEHPTLNYFSQLLRRSI